MQNAKKSKAARIIWIIVAVLFGLILIGSIFGDDSKSSTSNATVTATGDTLNKAQKDSIQKARTNMAPDLVAFYEENEVKADNELKGKNVVVQGIIKEIGKDVLNDAYIILAGQDGINNVQVYIEDEALVAELNKGSMITVEGECQGKVLLNIIIKKAVILETLK